MTAPPLSRFPLQVGVGMLCASYWRGAWYILDYTLFPHDRVASATCSLVLGSALLGVNQYVLSPSYNGSKWLVRLLPPPKHVSLRAYYVKMNRFVSIYMIALSCVLVWRGAWLLWDEAADVVSNGLSRMVVVDGPDEHDQVTSTTGSTLRDDQRDYNKKGAVYLSSNSTAKPLPPQSVLPPATTTDQRSNPNHSDFWTTPATSRDSSSEHDAVSHHDVDRTLFYSGLASHLLATAALLYLGRVQSVMAPPANVSMMRDLFLHSTGKAFRKSARSFLQSSS